MQGFLPTGLSYLRRLCADFWMKLIQACALKYARHSRCVKWSMRLIK